MYDVCGINCWLFWQVNNRKYPKLKEVDDVLGGSAAWENVDSTPGKTVYPSVIKTLLVCTVNILPHILVALNECF